MTDGPQGWSRRNFLKSTAVSTATVALLSRAEAQNASAATAADPRAPIKTTLKVNGRPQELSLDARTTLLDALREHSV